MAGSKKVGSFDPREVNLVVNGVAATGYADGTFINVSRRNDAWTMESGANGEKAVIRSADDSGIIECTLLMTSESNDHFSTLANANEKTSKLFFPVLLKDSNGTTVAAGSVALFQKIADAGFSKGVETRVWTILVPHLEYFVGGTADITP